MTWLKFKGLNGYIHTHIHAITFKNPFLPIKATLFFFNLFWCLSTSFCLAPLRAMNMG